MRRKTISHELLKWYDVYRRELPWRVPNGQKPDPYHVWLSEIMLQQTTVVTVGPYFRKFLQSWPTVEALAKAKRDDVLRLWAGLGYYRRAHALHEAAKMVVAEFGGTFPKTEVGLLSLPGCGPYTAAAIAAIAFNQRANVVDGNVERVMARLYAIQETMPKAKPHLKEVAAKLLPKERCGDYAQALMDLGATVCTPRKPKCDLCPLAFTCLAKSQGCEESLPRRERKKSKSVRTAYAFYVQNPKGAVLLRKRSEGGLLGGMMEVPTSSWETSLMPFKEAQRLAPVKAQWKVLPGTVRHVFSHFELEVTVAVATSLAQAQGQWIAASKLHKEALPSLMLKIIRHVHKYAEAEG